MALLDAIVGPIAGLLDKLIPDPKARDEAKLKLLELQGSQEMEATKTQLSAIMAEAQSTDPWTSRARPSFLYVMYALLRWAIPMGLIAAAQLQNGEGHRRRHERVSQRNPRAALRALRHRLSRLHRRAAMGKGGGHRQVRLRR